MDSRYTSYKKRMLAWVANMNKKHSRDRERWRYVMLNGKCHRVTDAQMIQFYWEKMVS
jgi:hypothetical protein